MNVTIGLFKIHLGKACKNAYRGPKEIKRSTFSRHPVKRAYKGKRRRVIDFATHPFFL
jgi:hypothetical protein